VAIKPEGWVGAWYKPQASPKQLTNKDRTSLQQQGRCWACHGSRHHSAHEVCPKQSSRPKQLNKITAETIAEDLKQAENM
jgi:succinate dehydrogenase/fumarate reductase-like Fe-S protein